MTVVYSLQNNDLLLDVSPQGKKYVLKIRDLPTDQKPREKLLTAGPSSLSVNELLAILFGMGTKKEGVLEMSSRILREYGERTLIHQTDPKRMAEDLGIPLIRALQVVACGELGRRFFQKKNGGLAVIRTARDVFNRFQEMSNLPKEHLRGIYLDVHHRVIHDEVISIGTIDSNIVHPREVFKPALEYGAVAVILAHNHPSGVVKPSQADIDITRQLVAAGKLIGINLIDHVIIAKNKFESIDIDY